MARTYTRLVYAVRVWSAQLLSTQDHTFEYKPGLSLHIYRPKDGTPNQKNNAIVFFFGGGLTGGSITSSSATPCASL